MPFQQAFHNDGTNITIFPGIVGEAEDKDGTMNYYIWTHKRFDVGYNGKQIVDVNLTKEAKHKLTPDAVIPFTYEVNWKPSNTRFENRFDKYLDPNFFQHRVSFSVYTSCVLSSSWFDDLGLNDFFPLADSLV